VSHSVAPVAVIAMEAPLGSARRILVGYDASANARAAAQWALGYAQPDAAITILDALGIAPWLAPDLVRERFPVEVADVEAEFRTADETSGRSPNTVLLTSMTKRWS